jgi:hypothetical protein
MHRSRAPGTRLPNSTRHCTRSRRSSFRRARRSASTRPWSHKPFQSDRCRRPCRSRSRPGPIRRRPCRCRSCT